MATERVRAQQGQWTAIANYSCDYQIEGDRVECFFTEAETAPTLPPLGNRSATPAVKTLSGGTRYSFGSSGATTLWAYPKANGAIVIVDDRQGADAIEQSRVGQLTAFGEQKVAIYTPLAAWTFPYNISSLVYDRTETNGGTVTHANAFAVIESGTNANGFAKLSTKRPVRYQPRQGGIVTFTAIFDQPGATDSDMFIGYGDLTDGYFFGYRDQTFGVMRISDSTQFFVPLADWSDPRGITPGFDPQLNNVYQIAFQWLGAGEIRFYIESNVTGFLTLVHRIRFTNTGTDVSIKNPNLPISAFVLNRGNTTNLSLRTASASAGLEGEPTNRTLVAELCSDKTLVVGTSRVPVISIRSPETYQGLPNRLSLILQWIWFATRSTGNATTIFEVFLNPTLTGPVNFTDVEPGNAPAQQDVDATGLTGGRKLTSLPLLSSSVELLPLTQASIFVTPGDTLTVTARSTQSSVNAVVSITYDSEV